MNDTDYLNSSENNKERLQHSIAEVDLAQTFVDSDNITSLMESMSVKELEMLKTVCDMLINFKSK